MSTSPSTAPEPRFKSMILKGTIGICALLLAGYGGWLLNDLLKPAPVTPPGPAPAPSPVEKAEPKAEEPAEGPKVILKSVDFSSLPGWQEDDFTGLRQSFLRSCDRLDKLPADRPMGPDAIAGVAGDWQAVCSKMRALPENAPSDGMRAFLTHNFTPYLVENSAQAIDKEGNPTPEKAADGLFTGYYESSLEAAKTRHGPYTTPIYGQPADLFSLDLGTFDEGLKGKRITGRVVGNRIEPYPKRAAIDEGEIHENAPVLLWAKDPVDVFFLHIQGSGLVTLPDGKTMRIGYAGNNGHGFVGIGRLMRERNILKDLSMQTIRDWLRENPEAGKSLMQENPRYIFFREIVGNGPIGAQGVALTPLRSLAVDTRYIPLGALLWLDTVRPGGEPLQRAIVAQDVGSAIKGVIRGDVFWGSGEAALAEAGGMKSHGNYYLLKPNSKTIAKP